MSYSAMVPRVENVGRGRATPTFKSFRDDLLISGTIIGNTGNAGNVGNVDKSRKYAPIR